MSQARINADLHTIQDAHPADLLAQVDREYWVLTVKVFSTAVATAVVLLAAEHANQTHRGEQRARAALFLHTAAKADPAATVSPIRVSVASEVRDIPEIGLSPSYANVHTHAR